MVVLPFATLEIGVLTPNQMTQRLSHLEELMCVHG